MLGKVIVLIVTIMFCGGVFTADTIGFFMKKSWFWHGDKSSLPIYSVVPKIHSKFGKAGVWILYCIRTVFILIVLATCVSLLAIHINL